MIPRHAHHAIEHGFHGITLCGDNTQHIVGITLHLSHWQGERVILLSVDGKIYGVSFRTLKEAWCLDSYLLLFQLSETDGLCTRRKSCGKSHREEEGCKFHDRGLSILNFWKNFLLHLHLLSHRLQDIRCLPTHHRQCIRYHRVRLRLPTQLRKCSCLYHDVQGYPQR